VHPSASHRSGAGSQSRYASPFTRGKPGIFPRNLALFHDENRLIRFFYSNCGIAARPSIPQYLTSETLIAGIDANLRFRKGASTMPDKETIARAQEDAREGKSPSTQAGEFVREEIHHVREGKHGASSPQQAIAIGLSKARRAGVKLGTPKGPAALRKKATEDRKAAEHPNRKISAKRSRATSNALKRESKKIASHQAVSQQAKKSAARRGPRSRHASAVKAAHTRKAA
jgi:hypothetical protein